MDAAEMILDDPVRMLDDELTALCKGRGLQEPRILDRLGATVREALGIRYGDDAAEQRRQLRVGLYAATRSLPDDMRVVFRLALGFEPAGPAFVGARLALAGVELDRHPRSMRRRLVQARIRVAENLAAMLARATSNNRYVQAGWYVDTLDAVFRLDLPAPRLRESRSIIVTQDGLSRITANMSMPSPPTQSAPPTLEIAAEEGCTVASSTRISASHWRYELDLPKPLRRGQSHRYVISFAVSLRDIKPYYVLMPFRDVRAFSAKVHFGSPPIARNAWRLDGVPPVVLDDPPATAPDFDTTVSPVVRVEFETARLGLCYGLHWE